MEKQRWIVLPLLLRCKPPADALQHFPAVGAVVDDHELSHDLAAGVVYAWDPADGVIPPEVWVFALLDDAVLLLICAYTGETTPSDRRVKRGYDKHCYEEESCYSSGR